MGTKVMAKKVKVKDKGKVKVKRKVMVRDLHQAEMEAKDHHQVNRMEVQDEVKNKSEHCRNTPMKYTDFFYIF